LCFEALCDWHLGETGSCHATLAEGIALAKELNDMHGLAVALWWAVQLAHFERDPAEVDRLALDLIELSTRQHFAFWLALAAMLRGWARTVSRDPVEGLAWIEEGIRDYRTSGAFRSTPFFLALKAEALHLADRTPEALETTNEAEALADRLGENWWGAELQRLRGVFLTTIGAEETQIEASFCAAIRIAREQKSISLEKRAEATYAEYRRQKASAPGGRGFRPALC
jgi:predicted ATPase